MKKVLSFSLYGNDPIYTIGCVRNAELHKTILNDWEMRVYYDDSVNEDILKNLTDLGVNLIKSELDNSFGRMWRFLPASENDVDYFISRDTDSRISLRDVAAVTEWIDSGKKFNIIREHPIGHHWWMNAGMWGCKGGSVNDIKSLMKDYYSKSNNKGDKYLDQHFLGNIIYPMTKNDVLIHDEFCNMEGIGKRIERDRSLDDFAFIGESVDQFDEPRGDQRTPIRERYNF